MSVEFQKHLQYIIAVCFWISLSSLIILIYLQSLSESKHSSSELSWNSDNPFIIHMTSAFPEYTNHFGIPQFMETRIFWFPSKQRRRGRPATRRRHRRCLQGPPHPPAAHARSLEWSNVPGWDGGCVMKIRWVSYEKSKIHWIIDEHHHFE